MIQWFKDGKALPRRYVWEIVLGAWAHFSNEESLVDLKLEDGVTVDVIGDVHGRRSNSFSLREERVHADGSIGQFYDMLHLYSLTGEPSDKHCLLMNGDLVDRGSWSIEVILTAFAYKCKQAQLNYQCLRINFLYCRVIPQEDVHQSRKS